MQEISSVQPKGWVQCGARCILLCGACGITPIPGDEAFGAVTGAATGFSGL
ncbi:hypothetical protein [Thomasclavelia cocleata]|uniref:hypothetical protein n=1 Tax=Thomasclavelia cocleata TaxID=69824 RepID=UPI0024331AC5|nr:hypothetical protein [Thomasclavelia cocleata]